MSMVELPYIRSQHHRPRQASVDSVTSCYSNDSLASDTSAYSNRSYKSYSSFKSHATFNSRGSFSSHVSESSYTSRSSNSSHFSGSSHTSKSSNSSIDSQDTCVVSRMKDNTPLEDMASFCKQNMVVGSLWECRAFTSDCPDLPDSILFLTFSIKDTEGPGMGSHILLDESTMGW